MMNLYLSSYPAYVPFLAQCTKADGDKTNPTVDNLIIYEEGGEDGTFDSTTITGSPFDPVQINSKTGLWGVLVPKAALAVGKFYIALWEMTIDGVTTAMVERFFAMSDGTSTGDTAVNHDTGGADNLTFVDSLGAGIDNAVIMAFLKTDYDAGNKTSAYILGRSTTDVNGQWATDIYLDAGNTYTIQAYKQGEYGPDTKEVTI